MTRRTLTSRRSYLLLWTLIAIAIGSFLRAVIASQLWTWFLSRQYGAGPSLGAWLGISSIACVVAHHHHEEFEALDEVWDDVVTLARRDALRWLMLGLTLLLAFAVGSAFGWVR